MKRLLLILILLAGFCFDSIAQADSSVDTIYHQPSQRWIRELRNIIIVSPRSVSESDTFNIHSPDNIFFEIDGRTIRAIHIVRLSPFGVSLTDTSYNRITFPGRAGNAIHVSTGEFIIRNALLFKEGDVIESYKLAYSERYLRSLGYIGDARVVAVPVANNEAEVVVTVQDNFPYSLSFGTNFETRANFGIKNNNIIGTGFELQAETFIDSRKDKLMGYRTTLRSSNIGRSFVSFQADYLDRYENQRYGFSMQRDFYAPTTKYAGHLSYYNSRTPARYYDPSSLDYQQVTPISIRFTQLSAWLGRSFQVNKRSFSDHVKNITLSLGAKQMNFMDRPERSEERYYRFQNRTTYLASLSYSQRSFYNASLIYNYGRTEDIPYGYIFSVVSGKEFNEMYNRPYFGANFSSGYFIPRTGYLSGALSYGTFFRNGADQGVVDFELNYFSNLYVTGNYRQRTFINSQYTRQLFNRLEDQLIIDDDYGIPGFRNDTILGRHRVNLSLEQSVFMPREIYGFRFVLYAFGYLSWLGGYEEPIILRNPYSSFGFGVRIRNNRLIINTLQIRLAYFPNIPRNSRFRYIHFSSETVLQPRDFKPRAPEIMPLY